MLKNYEIIIEEELKGSITFKPTEPLYIITDYSETPYEPKERRDTGITTIRGCGFGKEETRGCYFVVNEPNGDDE